MSNKKKINMRRVIHADIPIAFFYFGIALMHTAINSESYFVCFYDETGTGDSSCRSEEFNFHEKSILRILFLYRIAWNLPPDRRQFPVR
jgi:hypothetical protein